MHKQSFVWLRPQCPHAVHLAAQQYPLSVCASLCISLVSFMLNLFLSGVLVCLCVRACVYACVHTCVRVSARVRECSCTCTCVYVCAYLRVRLHACVRVNLRAFVRVLAHLRTCMYVRAFHVTSGNERRTNHLCDWSIKCDLHEVVKLRTHRGSTCNHFATIMHTRDAVQKSL